MLALYFIMSKELPYFRFYPSEWLEGDITLENERTQGFFITLSAWYWKKDCLIDLCFINKRLVCGKAMLKQCLNNLIESEIVKVDDNGNVTITFLDNQYDLLSEKRQKRVDAGRIGGKAMLKHRSSYKDKDKDKENNKDKEVFDNFWNPYIRKQGSKENAKKIWDKLTKEEQMEIIVILPNYFGQFKDKTFVPYPSTFLNQRRWENEIIKPKSSLPEKPENYDDFRAKY